MTIDCSQLDTRYLSTIFASAARVAVLRILMLDPRRPYYQRQMETTTGLPIRAIQRELDRLTSIDLLYRRNEGKRAYYQLDTDHPLFPELRALILKGAGPADRLRAALSVLEPVRLAFLDEAAKRALVVTHAGPDTLPIDPGPFEVAVWTSESFLRRLLEAPGELDPFLRQGVDLLGRRDDVIWRRIEAAGFRVAKGKDVP